MSMKENCPEIDSYIWHNKSNYNKLGPENRRDKKYDFFIPRDNWLTIYKKINPDLYLRSYAK